MKSFGRDIELPARTAPAFGVTAIYNIPLTADLDKVDIHLFGNMDVTGVGGVQVGDGIPELITSVDLVGDGNVIMHSVPFAQLVNGNIWRRLHGIAPVVSQPSQAVGINAYDCVGTLDLKAFGSLRPKDSTLREQSFRVLELRLNCAADFTGAFAGGTVSVAGSTINCNVITHETIELPDTAGKMSAPVKRIQNSGRDQNIAGVTNKEYLRLTPGQHLRGLTIRTQTAAKVNSDAILSALRIFVGNRQAYNVSGVGIISKNNSQMLAARPTGYYFVNFTEQQGSVERLNDEADLTLATLAGADAYLEYDTAAAGIVKVVQWGHIDI